ncbi:hypothetical protein BC629DRAFT_880229 [Irpex lacteus]|nr:hypothetical protein BC629DRAFT_880229 [Irpex lacteus]
MKARFRRAGLYHCRCCSKTDIDYCRYEFNGRQLKVHFDKFSASSATALPLAGLGVNPALGPGLSLSAPQSPRTSARPSTLTHAASFAQQLLMQQHEQARQNQSLFGSGLDSSRDGFLQPPFNSLQRSNTDSHAQTFRFNMDDTTSLSPSTVTSGVASAVPKSMFEHPGALNRAKSDSAQLFSHSGNLQTPPRMQDSQHSRQNSQSQLYQVTSDQPQQTSMHISLPPVRPPYAYDFSPGSPYDVYQFSTSNNGQYESWQPEQLSGQGEPAQSTSNHTSEAILRNPLSLGDNIFDNLPRPSTSPSPAPMSNDSSKSKPRSFAQHGHSQSESFRVVSSSTSPQNSQPQTQATSPTATSPTLSQQSASIQSSSATSPNTMHPAHPGPITSLPLPTWLLSLSLRRTLSLHMPLLYTTQQS